MTFHDITMSNTTDATDCKNVHSALTTTVTLTTMYTVASRRSSAAWY